MKGLATLVALQFVILELYASDQPAKAKLEGRNIFHCEDDREVKAFINEHADLYSNFEVEYIGGADPELVFMDKDLKELTRIPVEEMSTEEICSNLEKRGFKKDKEAAPTPPDVNDEL